MSLQGIGNGERQAMTEHDDADRTTIWGPPRATTFCIRGVRGDGESDLYSGQPLFVQNRDRSPINLKKALVSKLPHGGTHRLAAAAD